MNVFQYTNKSEKILYKKDIIFNQNTVCKIYNLNHKEPDEFGMTQLMYYHTEKMMYETLNNVTYKTKSGRIMKITPNCLEIGNNYLVIERYAKTFSEEIRKWCKSYEELQNFINEYIKPMSQKLDEMNIIHGDIHPRNIVLTTKNDNVSIIDFGLSFFVNQKKKKTYKNVDMLEKFIDDDRTLCYYPELCHLLLRK